MRAPRGQVLLEPTRHLVHFTSTSKTLFITVKCNLNNNDRVTHNCKHVILPNAENIVRKRNVSPYSYGLSIVYKSPDH